MNTDREFCIVFDNKCFMCSRFIQLVDQSLAREKQVFVTSAPLNSDNFRQKANVMKAVILAGGLGTRLSEETHLKPKPMVEVGGKPILWHIMKIYSSYGINEFIICCGYRGNVIGIFDKIATPLYDFSPLKLQYFIPASIN